MVAEYHAESNARNETISPARGCQAVEPVKRDLTCHIVKLSTGPLKGNTGGPPNGYYSQTVDSLVSGHLQLPHKDSPVAFIGGNDPLNQYEFPGIPEDFTFPFASQFKMDSTNHSDATLYL
ncbi:hypothetical protein PCH_Pc20g15740 [Penicillium rubens Wisconsin 54-1255]|uniref:Uncharacterized protein n=1 Tax=Penicillium rubens (strain ATCC 28089 / DSM 1075 / NRRL 1951 / Wisconsin 54-1255) TaxID=500485 RepID=B6HE63_PENRW|nr:hypothetical protein PCH_Pc20g15740 [Penicillium rubens Wisconsin 54-1255]